MIVCDCHSDTLYNLYKKMPANELDITMERLQKGGVTLQTLGMYDGRDNVLENVEERMYGMLAVMETLKKTGWHQVDDPSEAVEGKVSVMLSIEGAEVFERGVSTIADWRARGVRMAALTWNHKNKMATPSKLNTYEGLTDFGLQCVREMQKQHIAVDVSHLNERGFFDIFEKTDVPPMASHSCCAALRRHPRNLTDKQLELIIKNGGFVGINFYPHFLCDISKEPCTAKKIADHMQHIIDLGGAENVGFGSDFDGIECKPDDLKDPSDIPHLLDVLRERFDEKTVRGIAGENLLRYYERINHA